MATGIAILFSVLVFVSTASSSEFGIPSGPHIPSHLSSDTTDDDNAIRSVQLAGVWGIWHPRDTAAEFVWLHHDGRLTMRKANCGILIQGHWEYEAPFLEFINPDESRSSVEVTRVSNKTTGRTYLVMDYGGYVWRLLSRETEEGCS